MPCSDRKSTRLNSSHTEIYTLSLHDALPILAESWTISPDGKTYTLKMREAKFSDGTPVTASDAVFRSEEHTSELQSHRDLHSFPTRRSSDLGRKLDDFTGRQNLYAENARSQILRRHAGDSFRCRV